MVELNTVRLAGQRCLQLRHEWSHADDGDFVKRTVTRSTQSSPSLSSLFDTIHIIHALIKTTFGTDKTFVFNT